MVSDLERRLSQLASLRAELEKDPRAGSSITLDEDTVQAVTALATTIDAKDRYTEGHSRRVSALAVMLARAHGCSPDETELVRIAGMLHDIGKIAIPEVTLHKPGPLSDDEWGLMKTHPDVGVRILSPIVALRDVLPLVRYHHERWDGGGYPTGLAGEAIPIGARILNICDAYDTMSSDRPYRTALGHDEAVRRLRDGAGTQFDADLVDVFVELPLTAELPVAAAS